MFSHGRKDARSLAGCGNRVFHDGRHAPDLTLTGSYDYRLVAVSLLIAIFASYAALDLAGRVTAARGCVGLPAPTVRGGKVAEAASACQRRDQRDLLESAPTVASALSKVAGQG